MEPLELNINEDIVDVLKKIRNFEGSDVTLNIPENSVIFENILNLKLIKKEAEALNKMVTFETHDEFGKNMVESLEGTDSAMASDDSGFVTHENVKIQSAPQTISAPKKSFKFSMPKFGAGPKLIIPAVLLLVLGGVFFFFFWVLPKASVDIVVSSEALVKSITIKMSSGAPSVDTKSRLLPGKTTTGQASGSDTIDATGSKTVGEKATGEVTIFNKTDSDKKFTKGTTISLITSKEALKFTLDADVTVPKQTTTTDTQNPPVTTRDPGKKTVKVTAFDFGTKYNLAEDKDFKIGTSDVDDYIANNEDDFTGGSSKTVKAISQEDKDKLSTQLFDKLKSEALASIKQKLSSDQKLLESTVKYQKSSEAFDKNVGDTADKLTLTQQVSGSGLYYQQSDLQKLLDELLTESIPGGFELSKKDSNTEVGVLDTITGTTAPTDINLEVKIRALVVPKLDSEKIKRDLKGKKIDEAKNYLSEIKNIKSYTINIWPRITTLIGRLPGNESKIEVNVKKEN